jgi:arylsulfatase A-like enzyme
LESLRNYFAQVSLIDSGIGKILSTLERFNMDKNTIVIYTSDHGFSLGHNGIWGHGAAAFPSSAHRPSYNIPLIVAGGAVAENAINDGFVSQIDLFPTLASLVGAKDVQPSLPSSALDLGPALIQEDGCPRDAVFYEQEETRAIRTRDWVYAMRFQGAPTYPIQNELYRLEDDPNEKTNLSGLAEFAKVEAKLAAQISTYFEAYSDPKYDLWNGGTAKSNVTFQALWQDAWGNNWQPEHST